MTLTDPCARRFVADAPPDAATAPHSGRPIDRLIDGARRFARSLDAEDRKLFASLGEGQAPHTLFITCCDSRIVPNLVTSTQPGELFLVRNVGNVVPPAGADPTPAEAAALEYAIGALSVREVVVCGHSGCGAMNALLHGAPDALPSVRRWLSLCADVRDALAPAATPDDAAKANVVRQLVNLRTHPLVRRGEASGALRLHGWYYDIPSGRLETWSERELRFTPIDRDEGSCDEAAP